jgi:2-methylcitrate dehydratase
MVVRENPAFTDEYYDANKRAIPNSIQVFFQDGSSTDRIAVHYPIGHRRRRDEGIPVLQEKFARNLATRFDANTCNSVISKFRDSIALNEMPVVDFMSSLVVQTADMNSMLA